MLYVEQMSDELIATLGLSLNNNCYALKLDDKTIGYGQVNSDKENGIELYILKPYRGNGYGKFLFARLLENKQKLGVEELILSFSKNNICLRKIVAEFWGLQLSISGDTITYVIPLLRP